MEMEINKKKVLFIIFVNYSLLIYKINKYERSGILSMNYNKKYI